MNKLTAAGVHFLISAMIVGTVLSVIFFIWYPYPFFEVAGAWDVVRVLVGVDLVLGPCLTLVVYKPKKPRLRFDLSVIALIQISALVYGTYTIYSERPLYVVFAVDRFTVIAQRDIEGAQVPPEWRQSIFHGPYLAVAKPPEDVEAQQKILFEILDGAPDIDRRPELYHPYAENKDAVLARAKPLSRLLIAGDAVARDVADVTDGKAATVDDFVYVPMLSKTIDAFALVLQPSDAKPVASIDVDPWTIPEPVSDDQTE